MTEEQKTQFGMSNISNEWFKAKIDKRKLKELSRRSDYEGWKHIILYTLIMSILGISCIYTWGSFWFIPIYLSYCMFWGGADAIWHECGHRTAFKTRKLNDFFYHIASYMNNFEPVRWRWSHSLHHSYTASVDPHDFEAEETIFLNSSLIAFIVRFIPGYNFFIIHKSLYSEIIKHAFGIETRVMKECIPKDKKQSCIRSSRVFVLLWLLTILSCFVVNSILPVLLFLVPKFFIFMNVVWGLTQHIGLKEGSKDHRQSTRSVRLNPIFSFIYWKMEYHIEHHMFPMVPSYNLPKLYEVIKDQMPEPQTLYSAYKEIIPAVIKKSKNPDYFIPVQVPNN